MTDEKLQLQQRRWYALRVIPEIKIGWSAMEESPILVIDVKPLKSGKGLLRLTFAPLLYPDGPKELTADFRVVQHKSGYMIAVSNDFAGEERTCIFEEIDFDWLSKYTPKVLKQINSGWSPPESAQAGLNEYFGRSLRSLTASASPDDFPSETDRVSPMPEARASLSLNKEYSEYDSYLISKGFIPKQMEDKWLIYRSGDKLYFHRSWTGFCIYEVTLGHRDERLYLSHGYANREARQYGGTSDQNDVEMVYFLIDELLLNKRAAFPLSSDDED
jgi:hypothetical protein